ncbi:2-amino-4-hydroxy-6-hydroxymethyldihydropteridine diphosphokinase [Hydrogenimonas urashimensis]|uniref:2-amino-4-hydroxy-6- hydroxymethyldihydropteridine diphosphokinase n=1 Tax=Hydrogenimonas urashimensis TaxID=2740515 RepID=UPI0019166981|nr:2-amino-4-hydroxy-6-hydroxymethyldihydropteridine diphosphokinase [Hydrogenimonas urashimensis]
MSLMRSKRFPSRFPSVGFAHRALIGIGGNLGDVRRRFDKVVDYLRHGRLVRVLQTSFILKNPPFGYREQPDFYNAVLEVETELSPHGLLRYLLWVEKRFGRKRSFKNAPRTLDLDIIFYDGINLETKRLQLPHPHFHERESVMIPLMFLKEVRV